MARFLVVSHPFRADLTFWGRLAQRTGRAASEWQRSTAPPSLPHALFIADEPDARERAAKLCDVGLPSVAISVSDARGAIAGAFVAAMAEGQRSGKGLCFTSEEGTELEVRDTDVFSLFSGKQQRGALEDVFVVVGLKREPWGVIIHSDAELSRIAPQAESGVHALGELFQRVLGIAPHARVERALEEEGAIAGMQDLRIDDRAKFAVFASWVLRTTKPAPPEEAKRPEAAPSSSSSWPGLDLDAPAQPPHRVRTSSLEIAKPMKLEDVAPIPSAAAPSASPQFGQMSAADMPLPGVPGELAEVAAIDVDKPGKKRSPLAGVAGAFGSLAASVRALPFLQKREGEASAGGGGKKMAALVGVGVLALAAIWFVFLRAPPHAEHRLNIGDEWDTPYGVTFRVVGSDSSSKYGEKLTRVALEVKRGSQLERMFVSQVDIGKPKTTHGLQWTVKRIDEQPVMIELAADR